MTSYDVSFDVFCDALYNKSIDVLCDVTCHMMIRNVERAVCDVV